MYCLQLLLYFRTLLAAHWYAFNDAHSDISHYEWSVGTEPKTSDILSTIRLHNTRRVVLNIKHELPPGKVIYSTLRAYNKAGKYTINTLL